MYEAKFAYTKRIEAPYDEVVQRVRDALPTEGFGVLTEIDVKATLHKKLGVDRLPYVILGACNPALANRSLQITPSIGVFLPCNVDVFVGEDGATYVQTIKPLEVFKLVDMPGVEEIAREVDEKLQRVLEKV